MRPARDRDGAVAGAGWLLATCFVTGAIVLVLEVLGFRLFAPYFGSSVYVSGTHVGLVLAALSLGYVLGGRIADRRPEAWIVYACIFAAGLYLVGVLAGHEWLLARLRDRGTIAGTMVATTVIFAVPMVLLSMVSPYFIRLTASTGAVGAVAGNIFALSTLGSILGSLLATFVLIPSLGSAATLRLCVATLLATGAAGLWWARGVRVVALALPLAAVPMHAEPVPGLLLRTESLYNTITIQELDGVRFMALNDPRWRQSYAPEPGAMELMTYRELFALAPKLTDVRRVLILGMSAGASLRELRYYYDAEIDAVDIDPEVIRLAQTHFGVRADARTRLIAADARPFLARGDGVWDFVEIDLFQGGPEIPFYVATREFFEAVRARTSEHGVVMMNVIGSLASPAEAGLSRAVGRTMASVFPSVFAIPLDTNTVFLASVRPLALETVRARLRAVDEPGLKPFAAQALEAIAPFEDQGFILTDDWAPVDRLTHEVVTVLLRRLTDEMERRRPAG